AATTLPVTIPLRWRDRSRYFRLARVRVAPQPTYVFSTGLRSTASPKACIDQLPLALPPTQGEGTACRHSNEPLGSAGWPLLGPYTSAIVMWWIGKCSP